MSCKHKTLESAAPSDSSVAVSHIQRLIPKGGGLRETPDHTMNRLSYSPVAINLRGYGGLRRPQKHSQMG